MIVTGQLPCPPAFTKPLAFKAIRELSAFYTEDAAAKRIDSLRAKYLCNVYKTCGLRISKRCSWRFKSSEM